MFASSVGQPRTGTRERAWYVAMRCSVGSYAVALLKTRSTPDPRRSVLDRDECPDRGVGPDLRGSVQRELDAAEALRRSEGGSVERVERLAAVEVADPADSGVVVVRPVGVDAAHSADGDVLEDGPGAERRRCGGEGGGGGGGGHDRPVVAQRQQRRPRFCDVDGAVNRAGSF